VEDLNHMTRYKQHMGLLKVVAEENLENLEDLDVKVLCEARELWSFLDYYETYKIIFICFGATRSRRRWGSDGTPETTVEGVKSGETGICSR